MYYGIYDKYTIKYLKPIGKKPIVIRILDNEEPKLKNFDNVLTLYISDINKEIKNKNVFNNDHAKIINDFIVNNDFDEIIVHCTMGISRSPAIMAFIALIIDNNDMFNDILSCPHFIPNKLILDKIIKYKKQIKKINEKMIMRNDFTNYKDITVYNSKTKVLSFKI